MAGVRFLLGLPTYNKIMKPVTIRQSIFFLVWKLVVVDLLLITTYAIADLPILILSDTNPDMGLILSEDWFGLTTLLILTTIEMFVIIYIVLKWANENYEIRENDIIHRRGIIKIKEDMYSMRNFTAISLIQTIPGRIFRYGNVKLYNPALNHSLTLLRISNPEKYNELLSEKLPKAGENIVVKNNK